MSRVSKTEFLSMIQKFTANECISLGTVRNRRRGVLKGVRQYLGRINLRGIPKKSEVEFTKWLGARTKELVRAIGPKNVPWGIARKALNLFLRDCLYNHYLRRAHGLDRIEQWLEIPLDNVVAKKLKREADRDRLLSWTTLAELHKHDSDRFQAFALEYSKRIGLPARVFLDNYLWLQNR